MPEPTPILSRLIGVLKQQRAEAAPLTESDCATRSLDELGLDSVAMLSLLVAIEDEFGVEWREDVPSSTLKSLPSIAEYIGHELGTTA